MSAAAPEGDAPVLVCGLGHFGVRAAELLRSLGVPVSILTREATGERRRAAAAMGAALHVGDARDARALEEAGLASCRAVLALTDADLVNIEIALDARRARPDVPIVVRLFDQTLARQLEQGFGIRRAVAVSTFAAPAFAGAALAERTLGGVALGDARYVLAKHTVDPASPVAGTVLREMPWRHRLEVVAIKRAGRPGAELPDLDEAAAPGDQLYVMAERADWRRLLEAAGHAEPRRAPRRRRVREAASGLWTGTPRALRAAFLALVALMLVSVGVFSAALRLSPVDAFYFVVETVTTTGYGDITPRGSAALTLFACFVMLLGSAALATITSILTAYAVAERTRGRRVPREDHVLVVGVGALGLRTLEELAREGSPCVAVDRNGTGELVQGVRAFAPVVVGDARSEAVLAQAGVRGARAVVAVTSDDAANLAVGLAAKALNPRARVVVRLFDGELARKVESALDVDVAISSAHVAAPLLVASALAPNVATAFPAGTSLVALVEEPLAPELGGLAPERLRGEHGVLLLRVKGAAGWREAARGEPVAAGTTVLAARVFPAAP